MAVATSATTGRILKKNGWKVNSIRQISKIVLNVKMTFASFDNHPEIKTSWPGVARAGLYEVHFCWTGDIGIIKNDDICRILLFQPMFHQLGSVTSYMKPLI